jgi:hypothetical protein
MLRDDVLSFLEAIDLEPNEEINRVGLRFARLLNEFHKAYKIEETIDQLEKCFQIGITNE